ncbi:metallopeptidase TldD-related protein [Anaerocolumna xylanovorans]|uniref:Putative modulator of DNA gyrase n=1 Tax=Anaerocolumna xylanovorans DSM 12503 TaxID=1121345 RepID=A0A1M7YGN5_9FIRM|nr:metallopeptidase TldD-related protein [Anaerocolumna xylanovorans]SHO51729.1 Putative modulator of DNA gyrase [Anaerocolumna xylanovorans DSM 12503]
MLDKILNALQKNNIGHYLINEVTTESVELFFIRRRLDIRREKSVHDYSLTVYRDFEKDGKKMRGSSAIGIYNGMTEEELDQAIKEAYYAASFVCNLYYELPKGKKEEFIPSTSKLASMPLTESAMLMTEALFAEDTKDDVYLNSAEMFLEKSVIHILNSEGIDVSYDKYTASGEFVAQCPSPMDVETYQSFHYTEPDTTALKEKVKYTLETTKARAVAVAAPKSGEYKVIISGHFVSTIFDYYMDRSSAALIYPGYSNYTKGCKVQGENVTGDLLSINLIANEPYSTEGIKLIDRPLVTAGELNTIHGNSRFSHYLNTEPTGIYSQIKVQGGSKSFEEMKTGKYLHVVNFSDFQMDSFSGHYGGEIRLAFLCDGETVTPVTGGSINGSILETHGSLTLSKELQKEKGYEGPFAIAFEKVNVAGI